ncbi:MAG: VCBS repeat-containing protein [Phycisphaerae bacterium]|nr:VCBS repeat-containing protein [Phycisphaerae bacterium]
MSPAFGQACLDPLDRAAPFCPVAERVFDVSTNGSVIAMADVNADGAVDVLTLHGPHEDAWLPTYLLVHRNLCAGDFFETPGAADTYDFNTSGGPPLSADMVVIDLLGDPLPDVACIVGYPFRDHRLIILENRDAGSFAPPHIDLSLGTSDSMSGPLDIATADLDNDGDLDLVIVGSHSEGPRIWIAWNDNGFSQNSLDEHAFIGDGTPNRVAVGDLDPHVTDCNTNGGPDLLIAAFAGEESPALYVYLNRGCTDGGDHATRFDFVNDDGTFAIEQAAEALAVGHFNRDDHASQQQFPDVAWLAPDANRVYVFLNQWAVDAQEVFAGSSVDAVPTFATGMAVCDLDADGLDDVLVSSKQDFRLPEYQDFLRGAGTLTVLHNVTEADVEDEAEFERIDYPLTYEGVAVTCGDISRDGCLDAAVLARTFYPYNPPRGSMSFLHGRCDGTLRAQTDYGIFRKTVVDIDCGDFNADERMDIAVTNLHEINLTVLAQQDDGTHLIVYRAGDEDSEPNSPPEWTDDGVAAAVANFNGIDEDDLERDDIAMIFHLRGTGDKFKQLRVLHAIPATAGSVDFEVVVEMDIPNSEELSDIQAGDVDNSNGPDLVITDKSLDGRIHVLLDPGDGLFEVSTHFGLFDDVTETRNDDPVSLVLVDLDLDGDLDVVTANETGNTVSIMHNDGSGSFAPPGPGAGVGYQNVGLSPRAVAAGRIDGDDLPDIVTANAGADSVTVLLNDSTNPGTLMIRTDYLVGKIPVDVCVADFNGDCRDDIAVLELENRTLSILLNDGTGGFEPSRRIILQANEAPTVVTCCDLDANNKADLITSWNIDLSAIRLTYNECIGSNYCALPGDMNNDGLVDGDDIQPFLAVYYDPASATPYQYCAADLTGDLLLAADDVDCFVATLLLQACLDPCGAGEDAGGSSDDGAQETSASAEGSAQAGQGASESSAWTWQPDPDFIPKLECYLEWWRANMPRDYPHLTELEYRQLCIEVMLDCGLEIPMTWR